MYDKPVGISVLTNGQRSQYLSKCVTSLLDNTSYRPVVLAVFDNGSADDTPLVCSRLASSDYRGVEWRIKRSEKDMGCAAGTNIVSEMVRDTVYVLHLESDFLLLPPVMSGEDDGWLKRSVEFMEDNPTCDYLYLRRMVDENEARMHWWSQWMPKIDKACVDFLRVPGFWWSNNPHLRRNAGIYAAGCLPMDESKDGPKGTPGWSRPELEAKRPKEAWICRGGLFVHERLPEGHQRGTGACRGAPEGIGGCKYGFFRDGTQKWCQFCAKDKGVADMPEHEKRFAAGEVAVTAAKPFTVVTVDNGWSYAEFERITAKVPNARRIVMVKGAAGIPSSEAVEVISGDGALERLKAEADAALFCKVGAANRAEYEALMRAGVPIVVHVEQHQGLVDHMKNGFYYQDEAWAVHWLLQLMSAPQLRQEVSQTWREMGGRRDSMLTLADVKKFCPSCAERMAQKNITAVNREVVEKAIREKPIRVTAITPTWHRDPKVIRRAVDCMLLQTCSDWEQLVCSNGLEEAQARGAVESARDARSAYRHLDAEAKEGDFGNSARAKMIAEAKGKYIMFLDDDNIVLPNFVEEMATRLDNAPNCGFAVCQVMHFGPLNEEAVGKPPVVLKGDPVKLGHIDPLQVMVRREVMQKVGWDVERGYLSDGVTLEKLGEAAGCLRVEMVLGVHV